MHSTAMAELIVFRKAGEKLHLKENYNVRRNCSTSIVCWSRYVDSERDNV